MPLANGTENRCSSPERSHSDDFRVLRSSQRHDAVSIGLAGMIRHRERRGKNRPKRLMACNSSSSRVCTVPNYTSSFATRVVQGWSRARCPTKVRGTRAGMLAGLLQRGKSGEASSLRLLT